MGHLRYADVRRLVLTAPARDTFGRLSRVFRPPLVSAAEMGLGGIEGIAMILWQIVGGTISSLLYAVHLGVNVFAAHDDRTVELRADEMSAEAAGSAAALRALELLAMLPALTTYVQRFVPKGEAAAIWRRMLRSIREREAPTAPAWRQLSIRTQASLFASHPAPGRRYEWLAARPPREAAVLLTEAEARAVEREIRPYAEALHRTMLKAHPEDDL
jgi:heat shock protein HtpX